MILIQARSTSTRFPNKIMEKIDGLPMVEYLYRRCLESGFPAMAIIPEGDAVAGYLRGAHIPFYEGPEDDVLARYFHCAKTWNLQWVARVTADCPLLSTAVLHFLIFIGQANKLDFVSNCVHETTNGQEIEYLSFRMLQHVHTLASQAEDREHVTTWIKKNQEILQKNFSIGVFNDPMPIGPKMSVDTPEDLEAVRGMVENIKARKKLYA